MSPAREYVMVLNVLSDDHHEHDDHDAGGACSRGEPCGTGLEKIYPTTAVRFGVMRHIGEFTRPADMTFGCGAKVVVKTRRGIEIGEQVSLSCTGCSKTVSRDQLREYVSRSGPDYCELQAGQILRVATEQDLADDSHITADADAKRRSCQQMAHEHNLDMKVVTCEPLFGGERIIFYFVAEGRVDFRGLVRDLAREYQTRIEMRQVGARDEARLVADYETCGRECCCKNFLKTLRPVTMKMAKLQKATLDPSKVSGRCGRLKCCLRYEHVGYEELARQLPRIGARIHTQHGDGVVVARQVLTQLVQIETDEGGLVTVTVEDVVGPARPASDRGGPAGPGGDSDRGGVARPDGRQPSRPPRGRVAPEVADEPAETADAADDEEDEPTEADVGEVGDAPEESPAGEKQWPTADAGPPSAGAPADRPSRESDRPGGGRRRRWRRRGRNQGDRGPDQGGSERPSGNSGENRQTRPPNGPPSPGAAGE